MLATGAFVAERWGWIGCLALLGVEWIGNYLQGFYQAWKADRRKA
jgi:hypothetical protein